MLDDLFKKESTAKVVTKNLVSSFTKWTQDEEIFVYESVVRENTFKDTVSMEKIYQINNISQCFNIIGGFIDDKTLRSKQILTVVYAKALMGIYDKNIVLISSWMSD